MWMYLVCEQYQNKLEEGWFRDRGSKSAVADKNSYRNPKKGNKKELKNEVRQSV